MKKRERHGKAGSPEYIAWMAMKQRCYYEKNKRYLQYGGRGIKVCEKWKNSFIAFYTDMGDKPTLKHSLDRINVDGDYEPSNCKWSNSYEQASNKTMRSDNISGKTGVYFRKDSRRWGAYITRNGIRLHLGFYNDYYDALDARRIAEKRI